MLTFEIIKTNTTPPQKGLAPILKASPNIYLWQQLLWNKAKSMLLTYREESKAASVPDCRPSCSLSSLQCWKAYPIFTQVLLLIVTLCLHRTWAATIPDSKLLPRSIYDILTKMSNDFQWSICRVRCRHGASLLLFCIRFPLVFLSAIYLSVIGMSIICTERSLLQITSRCAPYCWLATSLFCLKCFWNNAYPTFKTNGLTLIHKRVPLQ